MAQRILIVEDDKELVEIYQRALTRAGYETACAYNGEEGLDVLKTFPADLIVLDLKMPKMSGDEFLKLLRDDPEHKDTKVLVVSSVLHKYRKEGDMFSPPKITQVPTRISQRAKAFGHEEGKFAMEEKKQPESRQCFYLTITESEPKFRRRLSVALVKKVKEILQGSGQKQIKRKEEKPQREAGKDSLEDKLRAIVLKYLDIAPQELTPDASFTKDLGVDSLDTIEMVIETEEAFDLQIPDEEADKIDTLQQAIGYIKKRLQEKE